MTTDPDTTLYQDNPKELTDSITDMEQWGEAYENLSDFMIEKAQLLEAEGDLEKRDYFLSLHEKVKNGITHRKSRSSKAKEDSIVKKEKGIFRKIKVSNRASILVQSE
jgi:hypothetical protein